MGMLGVWEVNRSNPCEGCGKPRRPSNPRGLCIGCYRLAHRVHGRQGELPTLTVRQLTRKQRRLYEAIMRGRRWSKEVQNEALLEVQRAGENVEAELAWWGPIQFEPEHKASSLVAMIELGPG